MKKKIFKAIKIILISLLAIIVLGIAAVFLYVKIAISTEGDKIKDFTVTTYDGQVIKLYETLEEKDMVLINLWATWCPPCRSEFPFMEEAYQLYKDDVEIIALSCEPSDSDEVLAEFVEEMGMSFPVGRDTVGIAKKFLALSIPTSIVVDSEGIVRKIEVGAMTSVEDFAALFDNYVSSEDNAPVAAGEKPAASEVNYVISFADEDGNAVKGVSLQVCDASLCQVFVSDSNGKCAFTLPAYGYELHLLKLPEGYEYVGEEALTAPENGGELEIVLKKA